VQAGFGSGVVIFLNILHQLGGTIRRVIIHNQNIKIFRERKHRVDYHGDILLFIISRYNDYRVVQKPFGLTGRIAQLTKLNKTGFQTIHRYKNESEIRPIAGFS
jgi:hypothetical protein